MGNTYFNKHLKQAKLHFAIMLDDTVIGDIYLKNIDLHEKTCELGIHLVKGNYKGKGYGTQDVNQMLKYAFEKLKKNYCSHRMLIKTGFTMLESNENMVFYVCHEFIAN